MTSNPIDQVWLEIDLALMRVYGFITEIPDVLQPTLVIFTLDAPSKDKIKVRCMQTSKINFIFILIQMFVNFTVVEIGTE